MEFFVFLFFLAIMNLFARTFRIKIIHCSISDVVNCIFIYVRKIFIFLQQIYNNISVSIYFIDEIKHHICGSMHLRFLLLPQNFFSSKEMDQTQQLKIIKRKIQVSFAQSIKCFLLVFDRRIEHHLAISLQLSTSTQENLFFKWKQSF